MEKFMLYSALLNDQIAEMFEEDSPNHIDLKELNDEENLKAFFHALSTVVPCSFFNRWVTNQELNHLEYNHLANKLCFEYCKPDAGREDKPESLIITG
jgi:hypothetical protein